MVNYGTVPGRPSATRTGDAEYAVSRVSKILPRAAASVPGGAISGARSSLWSENAVSRSEGTLTQSPGAGPGRLRGAHGTTIRTYQVRVVPPTLWFGDGRGGWRSPDSTIGLPCGKRKTIVLDLSGRLTPGDHRVKLSTTFEIRWDRAFFASGEESAPLRQSELPLVGAYLRLHGVSEPYYEVPDGPDMRRYDRLLYPPGEDPRGPIPGAYTRLGECSPLLRAVDDRYAIIGYEDEIRLTFEGAGLPPLPPGWKRDFAFITDGWTKDSDPNTVAGQTVEPLPFHGMKRYPYSGDEAPPDTPAHRKWRREWNTRVRK